MNKLLINESARNHIRFFPMKDTIPDLPSTESERILWCKNEYEKLRKSDTAKRHVIYAHRTKGYLISVWENEGRFYLIQCLRNEFKTFNVTIYISNQLNDLISIANFLKQNVDDIMRDYKDQILEARKALIEENLKHA